MQKLKKKIKDHKIKNQEFKDQEVKSKKRLSLVSKSGSMRSRDKDLS